MSRGRILVIAFLFVLVPSSWILAANSLTVVINEIAWMGTQTSYNDEWIELYNNTNEDINLEDWGLYEAGGETLIEPLAGTIQAKSYYLIERTDDNTVSDIPASQEPSSWGGYGLGNTGEHLQLLDQNSTIIDEVNCSENWFAGDNSTKQTMERKDPSVSGSESENWQTSQEPGGTPKAENSSIPFHPSEEAPQETAPATESPATEETTFIEPKPVAYPANLFLNEILPSPEGPDAENEWIELSNRNNFEVEISGWQIRDKIGAIKTYTIPQGTKIPLQGYLVFYRPETKITLQNSGDSLELLNPDDEVVDELNYEKAPLGQSFNRTLSGWSWSTTLTPGEENVITKPEVPEPEPSKTLEKREKTEAPQVSEVEEKKMIAEISEELPKSSNPFVIFLVGLAIAISSAIIVLSLKKRTETEER